MKTNALCKRRYILPSDDESPWHIAMALRIAIPLRELSMNLPRGESNRCLWYYDSGCRRRTCIQTAVPWL